MKFTVNLMGILLIFLMSPLANATQGMPKDFSADIVSTSSDGTMSMKLYTSGDKSRMEMAQQVIIVRRDIHVMWIVMSSQGMYMEQPVNEAMVAKTSPEVTGELERVAVGRPLG